MDRKTFGRSQVVTIHKPYYIFDTHTHCIYRDDLELVHTGVQTDILSDFTIVKDVNETQDKFTQTEEGECLQFENLVTSLACNAVKESLFELLNEEINMM